MRDNRDGHGANFSSNSGYEGETRDKAINDIRNRKQRNLLTCLLVSQGLPMILGGDEIGNSQQGNNNAYCQDNQIGWIDWRARRTDRGLQKFLSQLIAIRLTQPVLRRPHFLHADKKSRSTSVPDVSWYNQNAVLMSDSDWHSHENRFLGLLLPGDASEVFDAQGLPEEGDTLLLLFNLGHQNVTFNLNRMPKLGSKWQLLLDTFGGEQQPTDIDSELVVCADSIVIARCYNPVNSLSA